MDKNVYIKIAYWYYNLGLTQDEIARRLSLTRQKVNRIINSLVDLDIVTITVHGFEQDEVELECEIEQAFGLDKCIIAADYGEKETAFYKVMNVAAQYLDANIMQGMTVGVSWGRSLAETVKQMNYHKKSDCTVVQLMGAQNIEQKTEKSDEIVRGLANKLDCASYMLYAPVIVSHAETKRWMLKERSIRQTMEQMKRCDMAVLGIGELTEDATMCTRGFISKDEIHLLRDEGFLCDLCMNPLRLDGSSDDCPISDRLITADMEWLRDIRNTVAIACGEKKVDAIRAALHSGCVNTLIMDSPTAHMVMDKERQAGKTKQEEQA